MVMLGDLSYPKQVDGPASSAWLPLHRLEGLLEPLALDQIGIEAPRPHELGVATSLDDVSVVEDDNLICSPDGRDPMADDNLRHPTGCLLEGAENRLLRLGIHGAQGVVENEDRRLQA